MRRSRHRSPGRRRPARHAAADRPRAPARAAPARERARRAHGGDRRRRPRGRGRPRRPGRRSWRSLARSAATTADEARAQGLDPLTFRTLALDSGAGANLLQVAPLPATHSYSSLEHLRRAARSSTRSATSTGCRRARSRWRRSRSGRTAHAAFEAFTRERRERDRARGAAADPRGPRARVPGELDPDRLRRQDHRGGLPAARRDPARQLLDRRGQQPGRGAPRGAAASSLTLDPDDGSAARRHHRLDRPDRPPAVRRHRGHRLQDRQGLRARRTSTRASSCRSTRSPAATRWAWARRNG